MEIEQVIEELINGDSLWFSVHDFPEGSDENLEDMPNA